MSAAVFFDCDSTLLSIEALEWLVRSSGTLTPEAVEKLEALTNAGMTGVRTVADTLRERLELVPVAVKSFDAFEAACHEYITAEMREIIERCNDSGIMTFIVSSGPEPCVRAVGRSLGIPQERIAAVPFDLLSGKEFIHPDDVGFEADIVRQGKPFIVQSFLDAYAGTIDPCRTAIVGDGTTDMEVFTSKTVPYGIGYGVHKKRSATQQQCSHWTESDSALWDLLEELLLNAKCAC